MNPSLTTLKPVATATHPKTILSQEGFQCSLLALAPGQETAWREAANVEEHLLFVVEGEAIVRSEGVATILGKDEAMLIPQGKEHALAASPSGWAKILQIDVPPRKVETPQIISFAG